ncbi:hypothetical protein HKX48_003718 [Thoreauomyces humboldtii]|nr:hypothetical protein HKX48_003718 [Thoreauomyces humboldtii]
MPEQHITEFIIALLRVGLERLSLVPAELKSSVEVQEAIAAQELAVDVLASIDAAERASSRPSMDVDNDQLITPDDDVHHENATRRLPPLYTDVLSSPPEPTLHERAQVLTKSTKRLKRKTVPGAASKLPQELLLAIFEMVEDFTTLHSCCLVNRTWNPGAQEVLWREVLLDTGPRLRKFVRGVAVSATPRLSRRSGRSRAGLGVARSLEGLGEFLKPGATGFLELANGATRRFGTTVSNRSILPLGLEPRVQGVLLPTAANSQPKPLPTVGKGLGSLVKKLVVSSAEQEVILLQHVGNLLTNLQSLQFQHLGFDGSGPALEARILNSLQSVIHRATSLTVEDVDSPCWPDLCRILREHGGNLRNLNIEAVKDIDAFESSTDLSDVFPFLVGLEFLRLDGIYVGSNLSIDSLVSSCRNLQAITLDYCLEVTMDVLVLLWNGCPNISFLGMAGVVGPLLLPLVLQTRPTLKTLRLVDCDVFDEMFEEVALKATNLEMLRLVFEDDDCEGIVTVSTELTDRSLDALAAHNPTLRILALTRCPNMSPQALARVIQHNPIHTLDLHKHPECSIGGLDDNFLRDLGPSVRKVEVLNLYGQTAVTEEGIANLTKAGFWNGLQSISINNMTVGPMVLDAIRVGCPQLEVISIVDCHNIPIEAAQGFVEGRVVADMKPKDEPSEVPTSDDSQTSDYVSEQEDPQRPPDSVLTVADLAHMDFSIPPPPRSDSLGPVHALNTVTWSPNELEDPPIVLPYHSSYLAPRKPLTTPPERPQTPPASVVTFPHPEGLSTPDSPDARTIFYTPEPPPDDPPTDAASADDSLSVEPEPSPLARLRRVYTLATDADEEDGVIRRCDCWFVDEGLDIMSLWENAVRSSAGRGWVY